MKLASRAIIIHDHKVLLVKHKGRDFYSLPGGKANDNEDIRSIMRRELYEELGVNADVGNLLFVHEFLYPEGTLSLEFFFWIKNGADFLGTCRGEYAESELLDIAWIPCDENLKLMPPFLEKRLPELKETDQIEFHSEFR